MQTETDKTHTQTDHLKRHLTRYSYIGEDLLRAKQPIGHVSRGYGGVTEMFIHTQWVRQSRRRRLLSQKQQSMSDTTGLRAN